MAKFLSVIEEKFEHIHPYELVRISDWILLSKRLPYFVKSESNSKFSRVNLIFINEPIYARMHSEILSLCSEKGQKVAKVAEAYTMKDIRGLFAYTMKVNSDMNILSERNIEQFVLKNPWKIYRRYQASKGISSENYKTFVFDSSDEEAEMPDNISKLTRSRGISAVSIDTEMVSTTNGREVGRISIVDLRGTVLLDEHIHPEGEVIDYLTEFSGLTADSFTNAITMRELMRRLQDIIGRKTIIIGHGVDNDLVRLGILHERIIDTSRIYVSGDNRRRGLAALSKMLLNNEIQRGQHNSIEDARTCLSILAYAVAQISPCHTARGRYSRTDSLTVSSVTDWAKLTTLRCLYFVESSLSLYENFVPRYGDANIVFYEYNGRLYVAI